MKPCWMDVTSCLLRWNRTYPWLKWMLLWIYLPFSLTCWGAFWIYTPVPRAAHPILLLFTFVLLCAGAVFFGFMGTRQLHQPLHKRRAAIPAIGTGFVLGIFGTIILYYFPWIRSLLIVHNPSWEIDFFAFLQFYLQQPPLLLIWIVMTGRFLLITEARERYRLAWQMVLPLMVMSAIALEASLVSFARAPKPNDGAAAMLHSYIDFIMIVQIAIITGILFWACGAALVLLFQDERYLREKAEAAAGESQQAVPEDVPV